MPIVRVTVALAAALCALPELAAVVWHPARSVMAPGYFASIVKTWIEGGPFPGLGLAALHPPANGSIVSEGLAFLTGQELALELDESPALSAKLAVRLMHAIVEQGGVRARVEWRGPSGEQVVLEPTSDGRRVRARRNG